jgi:sortase A
VSDDGSLTGDADPGGPAPSHDDGSSAPPRASRHRHAADVRARDTDIVLVALRGAGQTLITAGLVVLLFVVYEVWVTNIFAHEKQTAVHNTLIKEWAKGDDPLVGATSTATLPGSQQATIPTGTGIANIYIPRLGDDYHFTIVQGTDDSALDKGPGHYVGTALPGQIGDFAVAGHRVGKGEPFLNLDHLVPGDSIVIETESHWYIYQVLGNAATGNLSTPGVEGVVGREIVDPSDGNVILPVPDRPGATPTAALLTLTTCHPKFTATKRMIVHAQLVRTVARVGNQLPKELTGGTL